MFNHDLEKDIEKGVMMEFFWHECSYHPKWHGWLSIRHIHEERHAAGGKTTTVS